MRLTQYFGSPPDDTVATCRLNADGVVMCGIAGLIDLAGERAPPPQVVRRMTQAIAHRGPDQDGYFSRPGLELGARRLSIMGLADGRQPVFNDDRSVVAVFNGQLFDYPETRTALAARGRRLVTRCDTELIPHLYDDSGEDVFERLRGQFAVAIWDERRRRLLLGRDRFGICPLYWTRQGDWLLFASEIKALLASGMVPARADRRGIDQIFTYAAMPGPITCFEGVHLLQPGRYLRIGAGGDRGGGEITERIYWTMDFPDRGEEEDDSDQPALVDRLEEVVLRAVQRRLRADVPVGAYLSGGVDSGLIAAMACRLTAEPLDTYTIRVDVPGLDEAGAAGETARYIRARPPVLQTFGEQDTLDTYPDLITAAEAPVIDTSSAALLKLAGRVHACGRRVVLSGEGADEWFLGYPWYKQAKLLGYLDFLPGLPLSDWAKRAYLRMNRVPNFPATMRREREISIGGPNPWIDAYGLLAITKLRFYSQEMREATATFRPYAELGMPLERAKRWDALNRAIWIAAKVTLGGHLLQAKGDRVAMHSSVETRYPFLDEEVFDFTSRLPTRLKLRGFRDKHLLRVLSERWLPPSICRRPKAMFRTPVDSFYKKPAPPYVTQLMSIESLLKTGYFDPAEVRRWMADYRRFQAGSWPRQSLEFGLIAVLATQLWHQTYISDDLAEMPTRAAGSATL